MKNSTGCDVCSGLGLLFARIPLGATLALAGYRKIHDMGVGQFVESNLSYIPSFMPAWFGKPYLTAVPWAELILGGFIVLGLLTRFSGFLAGAMLASFSFAVSHFFNEGWSPVPLTTPAVYACFAFLLLFAGPGKFSIDRLLFRPKA